MNKVIKFPTKDKHNKAFPLTTKEKELQAKQKLLRFHYKNRKQLIQKLAALDSTIASTELDYDIQVVAYAEVKGIEHIEQKYLDYCTKAKPVIVEDGFVLVIE